MADSNEREWPVTSGSAKARMVSSVDELIGRLPPGTRITIDVGQIPRFGLGRAAVVSVGIPDAVARMGGWKLSGSRWAEFSPESASGDHVFENALHDAFEAMREGHRG